MLARCPIPFLQEGVDGFGGGAHRNDYLLHFAVGSAADSGASELDVGENERPQPWMIAKKLFSHFPFCAGGYEPHPKFHFAHGQIATPIFRSPPEQSFRQIVGHYKTRIYNFICSARSQIPSPQALINYSINFLRLHILLVVGSTAMRLRIHLPLPFYFTPTNKRHSSASDLF